MQIHTDTDYLNALAQLYELAISQDSSNQKEKLAKMIREYEKTFEPIYPDIRIGVAKLLGGDI